MNIINQSINLFHSTLVFTTILPVNVLHYTIILMTNPSHGSRRLQRNVVLHPLLGTYLEGRLFSDLGHAGWDTVVKPATTIKETTLGIREIIVYSLTVGHPGHNFPL